MVTQLGHGLLVRVCREKLPPGVIKHAPQERKILVLIAEGLTNRQIGERLFLAEKTVKNNVSSLLAKLGMQRRTKAAVFGANVRGQGDLDETV